jgi:hypothetical protein
MKCDLRKFYKIRRHGSVFVKTGQQSPARVSVSRSNCVGKPRVTLVTKAVQLLWLPWITTLPWLSGEFPASRGESSVMTPSPIQTHGSLKGHWYQITDDSGANGKSQVLANARSELVLINFVQTLTPQSAASCIWTVRHSYLPLSRNPAIFSTYLLPCLDSSRHALPVHEFTWSCAKKCIDKYTRCRNWPQTDVFK